MSTTDSDNQSEWKDKAHLSGAIKKVTHKI